MYLIETIQKENIQNHLFASMFLKRIFKPEELNKATKIEIRGSSFKDKGADYCEFVLFQNDGITVTRYVEGY